MSVIGLPAQPVDATQALNLCWGFKLQGLSWSFVELTSHFVQIGLRMHRQVRQRPGFHLSHDRISTDGL
jgi:hypothetical protein